MPGPCNLFGILLDLLGSMLRAVQHTSSLHAQMMGVLACPIEGQGRKRPISSQHNISLEQREVRPLNTSFTTMLQLASVQYLPWLGPLLAWAGPLPGLQPLKTSGSCFCLSRACMRAAGLQARGLRRGLQLLCRSRLRTHRHPADGQRQLQQRPLQGAVPEEGRACCGDWCALLPCYRKIMQAELLIGSICSAASGSAHLQASRWG